MRPRAIALVAAALAVTSVASAQEMVESQQPVRRAAPFTMDGAALPKGRLPVRALDHIAVLYALKDARAVHTDSAATDGRKDECGNELQFAAERSLASTSSPFRSEMRSPES